MILFFFIVDTIKKLVQFLTKSIKDLDLIHFYIDVEFINQT